MFENNDYPNFMFVVLSTYIHTVFKCDGFQSLKKCNFLRFLKWHRTCLSGSKVLQNKRMRFSCLLYIRFFAKTHRTTSRNYIIQNLVCPWCRCSPGEPKTGARTGVPDTGGGQWHLPGLFHTGQPTLLQDTLAAKCEYITHPTTRYSGIALSEYTTHPTTRYSGNKMWVYNPPYYKILWQQNVSIQ